jgi:hypothetical protein
MVTVSDGDGDEDEDGKKKGRGRPRLSDADRQAIRTRSKKLCWQPRQQVMVLATCPQV